MGESSPEMISTDYLDSSALVKRYLDDVLLKAAQAEGLHTENPNLYP